jgi:Protein of unknown function (DUF2911)
MTGTVVKRSFFPLFCFFLFACNNKKEKTPGQTTTPEKDSSGFIKTESSVNPYATVDVSPMDMSYYPSDYPKLKMAKTITTPPLARVVYSRPHLGGRRLFHEVQKYGEYWRLGANEATELQLYKDAVIQDKKIRAGRYVLYCIPQTDNWTIILNSNIDSWGLHQDSTKDVFRFTVPAKQTNQHMEYFTMIFQKIDSGAELLMTWDNVEARLPVSF